jgi:hypothetical protein
VREGFERTFELDDLGHQRSKIGKGVNMSAQLATQLPAVPRHAQPLQLTRRGRLLLIGLPLILSAAALLTLIGFFTAPAMASPSAGLGAGETITVTVGSGQTLWEVASAVAPERNPHDVIAEISQLNNLPGSIVQAGQQLHVPVSGIGERP